jgi:hypothetical protein
MGEISFTETSVTNCQYGLTNVREEDLIDTAGEAWKITSQKGLCLL